MRSDTKSETRVFRISPRGVSKLSFSRDLSTWGVWRGEIYGGGKEGSWKWKRDTYVPLTQHERDEFDAGSQRHEILIWGEASGWRALSINPISVTRVDLNGTPVEIQRDVETGRHQTLDVTIGGKTERLWEAKDSLVGLHRYTEIFR